MRARSRNDHITTSSMASCCSPAPTLGCCAWTATSNRTARADVDQAGSWFTNASICKLRAAVVERSGLRHLTSRIALNTPSVARVAFNPSPRLHASTPVSGSRLRTARHSASTGATTPARSMPKGRASVCALPARLPTLMVARSNSTAPLAPAVRLRCCCRARNRRPPPRPKTPNARLEISNVRLIPL